MNEQKEKQKKRVIYLAMQMGILLLVFLWNYQEIKYKHTAIACNYLHNKGVSEIFAELGRHSLSENVRFFGHSIYHSVCQTSIVNAAAFFALFALVIAMLQTIYPFRLGKLYNYPISRLDRSDIKKGKVENLAVYVLIAIISELFGWYLVEATAVIIGYWLIVCWIHKLTKWYKKYEDREIVAGDCLIKDMGIVMGKVAAGKADKEPEEAEEEFVEFLTRILKSDDIGKRAVLKRVLGELSKKNETTDEGQQDIIFNYSCFLGDLILEDISTKEHPMTIQSYQVAKEALFNSSEHAKSADVFVVGLLCGCIKENRGKVTENCVCDLLKGLKERASAIAFVQTIGILCIYLELSGRVNDNTLDVVKVLIEFGYLAEAGKVIKEGTVRTAMTDYYCRMRRVELIDYIDELNLVKRLQNEIANAGQGLPTTVIGRMLSF